VLVEEQCASSPGKQKSCITGLKYNNWRFNTNVPGGDYTSVTLPSGATAPNVISYAETRGPAGHGRMSRQATKGKPCAAG
jgi:hypothetical protein